jgi:hypothetical protein
MIPNLTFPALDALLRTVFAPTGAERGLLLLVDLPAGAQPDHAIWQDRRRIAGEWYRMLRDHCEQLPWSEVALAVYPNVGSNNAELPAAMTLAVTGDDGDPIFARGTLTALDEMLARASVVLAPTELSATAPLKLLAKRLGFRGATCRIFGAR